jgi:mRNA-degrading endonuclease RelE of RelBE toxin-antitoxin system
MKAVFDHGHHPAAAFRVFVGKQHFFAAVRQKGSNGYAARSRADDYRIICIFHLNSSKILFVFVILS